MTKENTPLEEEIERLHKELLYETPSEEKYKQILTNLATLYELNKKKRKFEVSGDTIVLASVNLLGIIIILQHENLNVISSKALGFVSKLRL